MWDASKCNYCGDCLTKCLYVNYDRDKAVSDIKALMEGKEADIVNKCVTCCACREYCPTGADPLSLIINAVEKAGVFPIDEETLIKTSFDIPSEIIPGDPAKPAMSICTMERYIPEGTLDGQIFKGMTRVKGGDYFCLIGWEHYGKESPIEKYAQQFINNIASLKKDIVFLHDDCYAMVHTKIKDYGIEVPFNYMHIFEYLRNYLRYHRSNITRIGKKIAYQQPCASRYTPDKNAFLDEIFELIGVERPKRKYERETALCCTAPIIGSRLDLAVEFQEKNVKDAIECGADALITLCPVCDRVMRRPTGRLGLTKIYITDLCRIALNEIPWPIESTQ
jgi:Fe-S oxidoreductase